MSIGFLPFGSDDSSVVFQHDLKSNLALSDGSSIWSVLEVGTSVAWTDISSASVFPLHDSNGMRQVRASDGSTPIGYRFRSSVLDLTSKGQISFKIQREAIESYDATYNSGAWQPSSTIYPIAGFSGSGNDHIYFLTIESGTSINSWHGCAHISKDIENGLHNGALQTEANPPKLFAGTAYDEDGYALVEIAWKGDFSILAIDGILVGWGNRTFVTGSANYLEVFYIGGRLGAVGEMLTDYYMKDLQISTEFPQFSCSPVYPCVGVISDSMFDDVGFDATLSSGGIYSGVMGINKAFNEKGLYTKTVVSENSGQKLDNSIVVSVTSITQSGSTATLNVSADPGWDTGDFVSVTGANESPFNGTFSFTRVSGTQYTYGMSSAPGANATGTITAGRSLQVSVKNLLNDNANMAWLFSHALTNDLNSPETSADSEADYKTLIDTVFAHDNIRGMTIIIPPARLAGGDLDLQEEYVAMLPGLKAYVSANHPTKKLNFADVWTATGGRSPNDDTLRSDNIHYAATGASHLSKACYHAMKTGMSL